MLLALFPRFLPLRPYSGMVFSLSGLSFLVGVFVTRVWYALVPGKLA